MDLPEAVVVHAANLRRPFETFSDRDRRTFDRLPDRLRDAQID